MVLQPSARSLVIALAVALTAALIALLALSGGGDGLDPGGLTVAVADGKPDEPISASARAMVTATTAWLPGATVPTVAAAPSGEVVGEVASATFPPTTRSELARRAPLVDSPPPAATSSATSPPNAPGSTLPALAPPTTLATVPAVPTTAVSPTSDANLAARVVAHHNRARAGRGLPPLLRSSCLDGVAARWAAQLASTGELLHNPSSAAQSEACLAWNVVGENVGYDGSVEAIDAAWMGSVVHQANILNAAFTQVGVGVVHSDGFIWVVVNFVG